MDIFYNALKIIYENTFADFKEDEKKKPREYAVLKEFLQLVFENYKQEHKVSFYANEIGLTLSHFCATIKKATGKNGPGHYKGVHNNGCQGPIEERRRKKSIKLQSRSGSAQPHSTDSFWNM